MASFSIYRHKEFLLRLTLRLMALFKMPFDDQKELQNSSIESVNSSNCLLIKVFDPWMILRKAQVW